MINATRQIIRNEGAGALLTGFGPTFSGYFLQGALKFGGYEFWKKTFIVPVSSVRPSGLLPLRFWLEFRPRRDKDPRRE